jgi:CDP-glucose 4,6-dehydratase
MIEHPGYKILQKFFTKKKILITGNTGFKGSWLTIFLSKFNCSLYGYSNGILTNPSLYNLLKLNKKITTYYSDIRDTKSLNLTINEIKPDIIFHLAAQSLVTVSVDHPRNTFLTNAIGTLNLLEVLRTYNKKVACIFVTSDKCYNINNRKNYFKETDVLGGEDPYSASKACAEIIYKSYFNTYLKNKKNIFSCTVRAGNVVGGGDWSKDRIMKDIFEAIQKNINIILRNPNSNRPWQHVFEPIWAYILLSKKLYEKNFNGESFNIGPNNKNNKSVIFITKKIINKMNSNIKTRLQKSNLKETNKLNLNTSKIKRNLGWTIILNNDETINMITDWYKEFFKKKYKLINRISLNQIDFFINKFFKKNEFR